MKWGHIFALAIILASQPSNAQQNIPIKSKFDPALAWQPKSDLKQSFEADFMVMMATMFPNSPASRNPESPGYLQAKQKEDFVKRMYLLLLLAPPVFIPSKQPVVAGSYDTATQSVSYLMRGRRWNIDITGVPAESVVTDLTGGAPITFFRTFASHGAHINKSGQIIEDKLSGLKTIQTFTHGLKKRHIGINIPLGGYGNPAINNAYLIGEDGTPLNGSSTPKNFQEVQHGHVYMYAQTFGENSVPSYIAKYLSPQKSKTKLRSILLLGIEPAAPGQKSMFGVEHNIQSGFKDSTVDPSLTNSKKWKHSGIAFQPADYGGMVSYVDAYKIGIWKNACNAFLKLPQAQQQAFMAKWLRLPARNLVQGQKQMLAEIFGSQNPQIYQQPRTLEPVQKPLETDKNPQNSRPLRGLYPPSRPSLTPAA